MTHPATLLREPGANPGEDSSANPGEASDAGSGEAADAKTAPPIRLRNPRWDRKRAPAGGKAIASVEAELPEEEWRTRVEFTWWELHGDGTRTELGSADGHILRGKAWALFRVPGSDGAAPPDGAEQDGAAPGAAADGPARDGEPPGWNGTGRRFQFTARHALSREEEGPVLEMEHLPRVFDGMLLYSPSRGAYLALENRDQAGPWMEEIREMRSLLGGTRRAWEIRDAAARWAALSSLAGKAARLFGEPGRGAGTAPHRVAKSASQNVSQIEELVVLASNPDWGELDPWVFVRTHAVGRYAGKSAWRAPADAGTQAILDGLASPAAGTAPCQWLGSGIRHRLLKSLPSAGRVWDWHPLSAGAGSQEAFRFGATVALVRFMLGWDGSRSSWDFRSRKAMLGGSSQAGFAFPEGSLSGTWHWPDADGVDLLEHLDGTALPWRGSGPGRECRLRCTVEAGESFLAGVPPPLSLAFPALEAAAGWAAAYSAHAKPQSGHGPGSGPSRIGIRVGWAWSSSTDRAFADLAAPSFRVIGRAGRRKVQDNAGSALRIDWHRGKFRFEARNGLAERLGCGTGVLVPLSPEPGADLIGHLLHCLDFHRFEGLGPEAYRACADIHLARLAAGDGSIADRTALHRAPPESLAKAILARMRSRGLDALQSVLTVLSACRTSAAPAECHKLRWVFRHLSESDIPPYPHPGREAAKRRGLEEGRRRFRRFADRCLSDRSHSDRSSAGGADDRLASRLRTEIERILSP